METVIWAIWKVVLGLSCSSYMVLGKQFLPDHYIIWYCEMPVKYLKNLAEQQS